MSQFEDDETEDAMDVQKEIAGVLFNGQTAFVVPYFQRSYVWDEENWERFLEDIETIEDKEYFMGFIVLKAVKRRSPPAKYSVIDGQQRLTTFFLFAKALCEVNEDNINKIKFYSNKNEPILFHNHIDKKIFDNILEKGPLNVDIEKAFTDNKSKILKCYKYFLNEKNKSRLEKIDFDKVLKYLSFVCMYLGEDDDEQKIFDTMNSLGEPLRIGDLLKNELFSDNNVVSSSAKKLYENTWKKTFEGEEDPDTKNYWDDYVITKRLKQSNLDVLLHAYLAIRAPDTAISKTHGALFKQYKAFLKENGNKEEFINELIYYANIYRENIDSKDSERALNTGSLTQKLNIIIFELGVVTIIPYVLYILREVQEEKEKRKIFELIEVYLMRRFIAGQNTTRNYNIYFVKLISKGINTYDKLREAFYKEEDTVLEIPNDVVLSSAFENNNTGVAKTVLYFLEHEAKPTGAGHIFLPYKSYSLEHIMPQKWEDNWKSNLPKEEVDAMIHKFGNLTLLTSQLNSSLKNASWRKKKEGVASKNKKNKGERIGGFNQCCSSLATFSEYLKEEEWDEDMIAKRNNELLDLTKLLWSYEPPA